MLKRTYTIFIPLTRLSLLRTCFLMYLLLKWRPVVQLYYLVSTDFLFFSLMCGSVYMYICVACFGVCTCVCVETKSQPEEWATLVFWGSPSLQPGTHLFSPWSGRAVVSHLLSQHGPCKHSGERTRKDSWPSRVGDLPRLRPEKLNQLLASLSNTVKEELPPAVSLLLRDLPSTIFGKRIDFGLSFVPQPYNIDANASILGFISEGHLNLFSWAVVTQDWVKMNFLLFLVGGEKEKKSCQMFFLILKAASSLIATCKA